MVLEKKSLDKVRFGVYKCGTCGTYYDPTYVPCPNCNPRRRYYYATAIFAIIVLMFMFFWLPLEAQAQAMPGGCVVDRGIVLCNQVLLPMVIR